MLRDFSRAQPAYRKIEIIHIKSFVKMVLDLRCGVQLKELMGVELRIST